MTVRSQLASLWLLGLVFCGTLIVSSWLYDRQKPVPVVTMVRHDVCIPAPPYLARLEVPCVAYSYEAPVVEWWRP